MRATLLLVMTTLVAWAALLLLLLLLLGATLVVGPALVVRRPALVVREPALVVWGPALVVWGPALVVWRTTLMLCTTLMVATALVVRWSVRALRRPTLVLLAIGELVGSLVLHTLVPEGGFVWRRRPWWRAVSELRAGLGLAKVLATAERWPWRAIARLTLRRPRPVVVLLWRRPPLVRRRPRGHRLQPFAAVRWL